MALLRRLATSVATVPFTASLALAQTLEDARERLSDQLRSIEFAESLTGLVDLSDSMALNGGRFSLDDGLDTKIRALVFPFRAVLTGPAGLRPGLYVEGAVGYARATQRVDDIFQGILPGFETSVESTTSTWGGLAGIGARFRLRDGLTFTPALDFGAAHLQNRSELDGPLAEELAALLDGIAFNWDATVGLVALATQVDWTRTLGDDYEVRLQARHDTRRVFVVESDDRAQDFNSVHHLATLRADLEGPTPFQFFGLPVGWQTTAGYQHFFGLELFDGDGYGTLGAGLRLHTGKALPLKALIIQSSIQRGRNVTGFRVGVGARF